MTQGADGVMQDIDQNVVRLVTALNAFDGIRTLESCGGHETPKAGQRTAGDYYIAFEVEHSPRGWLALELLAWAINVEWEEEKGEVNLYPLAYPGHGLSFVVEGSFADPDSLAAWLNEARQGKLAETA